MNTVVLLRGINVGGNRKVPMLELCQLMEQSGFSEVRHYINSGNLVLESGKVRPKDTETVVEQAIEERFGFHVDVIARSKAQWKKYSATNPFSAAAKARPHLLHLGLCKAKCNKDMADLLESKATLGEKIEVVGEAVWVDFAGGAGKSKLTPALFEKAAGSPVTFRNWNTVIKLAELLK